MDEPILQARAEASEDGSIRLLAPGVGWWSELPGEGALLGAGSSLGRLRRLNRDHRLVVPPGTAGRVGAGLPRRRVVAVEFGQELVRLFPVHAAALEAGEEEPFLGRRVDTELPAGARAVVSPTDGVFYRRPSPEAPPFVAVGQRVRIGQPVGLVEVMKTFNQIHFDGPGCPEEAEVLEIRAEDGQEVRAGQVLLVLR